MKLEVIFQSENLVAIDKPEGFHVHPHQNSNHRTTREKTCLFVLRDQIGQRLFPVHRLDAATSGVLLFALNSESAREIQTLFQTRKISKTYEALVRGYVDEIGQINIPMSPEQGQNELPCTTNYRLVSRTELNFQSQESHPTSRISLLQVTPVTGRFHQIRRHFARIAHPVLGDSTHGDTRQNRKFREFTGIPGLCLRATQLQFNFGGSEITITPASNTKWLKISSLFETKPLAT